MAPLDSNWASVMAPGYVYVGIVKRDEFDRLALPATDHGAANPERPVLTKTANDPSGCTVVFQHWYGPTPAEREAEAVAAKLLSRRMAARSPQLKGAVERAHACAEQQLSDFWKARKA